MKYVSRARIFLMVAILLSLFVSSLEVRNITFNRFPAPGDYLWRSLHTHTLNFTRNWHWEGPLKHGFTPGFHSASVEKDGHAPYVSYPPMFVIIPWAIASLLGQYPTLALLMKISLGTQLLSVFLFLILLRRTLALSGIRGWASAAAATLAASFLIFVPAALLFFQNTWWADIAVIPFFLLMLIFDSYSACYGDRRWFRIVTALLVFLGCATDWLFHCLVACIFLRRLTSGREKKFWPELLLPMAVQIAWHAVMVVQSGRIQPFFYKIQVRSGLEGQKFSTQEGLAIWLKTLENYFGSLGLYLCFALLVIFPFLVLAFFFRNRFGERVKNLCEFSFLITAPMLIHFSLLHEHYIEHVYEFLKLTLPLLSLAFVVLPALFWMKASSWRGKTVIAAVLFCAAGIYASAFPKIYRDTLGKHISLDPRIQAVGESISAHVGFNDVLISPDFFTRRVFHDQAGQGDPKKVEGEQLVTHKEIYLADEPATFRKIYLWRRWEFYLKGKEHHFRGVFLGEPKAIWQKYLTKDQPISLGHGYFLYDLNVSSLLAN